MTRIISGVLLLAFVLGVVLYAPEWLFLAVLGLIVVLAVGEYAALATQSGLVVPRMAAAAAALVVGAAVAMPAVPVMPVLAATLIAVCVVMLAGGAPAPHVPGSAAAALFPAFYIGIPLGLVGAVRAASGPQAVLFVIVTVAVSDTAQYFVGSAFGKHRLSPVISPKKSVEGAVGGFVAGAAVAVLWGRTIWPEYPLVALAGLGLVLVALGIIGDLFESLMKRSAGVKDSSNLIPGHGGVLDRIDALLLAAPGYYLFTHLLR